MEPPICIRRVSANRPGVPPEPSGAPPPTGVYLTGRQRPHDRQRGPQLGIAGYDGCHEPVRGGVGPEGEEITAIASAAAPHISRLGLAGTTR